MKILEYYPDLSAKTASNLNFAASTIAGVIFCYVGANLNTLNPVLIATLLFAGMMVDAATVPFVHSGVISERYKSMKHSELYLKIHVPPATLGYTSMLFFIITLAVNPVNELFYFFAACWSLVYISGAYAYIKVRRHNN